MKATTKFIEDAIKGGWCDLMKGIPFEIIGGDIVTKTDKGFNSLFENVSVVLLDPKAWEAVGEVRGWEEPKKCLIDGVESHCYDTYQNKARNFFQYVLDGKNIEEALQAIE